MIKTISTPLTPRSESCSMTWCLQMEFLQTFRQKRYSLLKTQILTKDIYFGRYGKVIKSILNPPYPFKKGTNYQVYATYES